MAPKRSDPDHIPRPSNRWIFYRADKVQESALAALNLSDASAAISALWKEEPPAVKQYYKNLAVEAALLHKLEYPDYKYRPRQKKTKNPNATSQANPRNGKAKQARSARGAELHPHTEHVPLNLGTESEAASLSTSTSGTSVDETSGPQNMVLVWPLSASTTPELQQPEDGDKFESVNYGMYYQPVAATSQNISGPTAVGHFIPEANGSQTFYRQWHSLPNMTPAMPQAQQAIDPRLMGYSDEQLQQVNWYNQVVTGQLTMAPFVAEASGSQSIQGSDYLHNPDPAMQQAEAQLHYFDPAYHNRSGIQSQPVVMNQANGARLQNMDFLSAASAGPSPDEQTVGEMWNDLLQQEEFSNDFGNQNPAGDNESTENTSFNLNVPPPHDNLDVRAGEVTSTPDTDTDTDELALYFEKYFKQALPSF